MGQSYDFDGDLLPNTSGTNNLGNAAKKWSEGHFGTVAADTSSMGVLSASNVAATGAISGTGITGTMFTNSAVQTIDMDDDEVVLTITGTPAGTVLSSNILRVDANSGQAGENLLLPPEADWIGMVVIVNTGGENIVVKNDNGDTIDTIATAEFGIFFSDGVSISGMNQA